MCGACRHKHPVLRGAPLAFSRGALCRRDTEGRRRVQARARLSAHVSRYHTNTLKMRTMVTYAISVVLLGIFIFWTTSSTGLFIPNLTERCYRCLCYVSTKCDMTHDCTGGYCGPFNISRVYWVDAGRITLPNDEPERNKAWIDCAQEYYCATRIIEGYLQRFGRDCNNDGVTNCYDYMMVNGNGGYGCTKPLNRSANGRRWLQRYEECQLDD